MTKAAPKPADHDVNVMIGDTGTAPRRRRHRDTGGTATPAAPRGPTQRERPAGQALGAPWQRLYFLPEPHGQGPLREGSLPVTCPGAGRRFAACSPGELPRPTMPAPLPSRALATAEPPTRDPARGADG